MGNVSACCSSSAGTGEAGSAPLKDEVKGIDDVPAPGMATQDPTEAAEGSAVADAKASDLSVKKNEDPAPQEPAAASADANEEERQFVTYQDGSTYTGMIKKNKRDGHGIWQSKNCQYEGQWKADSQHGQGRQTWSDGRVYEGQFQNGRFSGTGRMVWHTQKGLLVYEGEYKDDLKHGHGKFVWTDGRTYDGEWHQGKRHGRGTYVTAKAERKVGYWEDDKFSRWETARPEGEGAEETPAAANSRTSP
eukprot:TRINITY_DN41835_c0_g1_i1.p1 TRINITY_DN41835_c0_g1~~TRINITY_DN41835_c0_g1_i1.p1  ORF type:complete len:248 (+),score=70.89 TRINITY_DN41835_c0_g1_i1:101-844(+)